MTENQMLRMERRRLLETHRRERRAEAIRAALVILGLLLAYALAGTLDYADRAHGLGADMMPSQAWWEVAR